MTRNNLNQLLAAGLVVVSTFLPIGKKANAGTLQISNRSASTNIGNSTVSISDVLGNANYVTPVQSPTLEIFYEDPSDEKWRRFKIINNNPTKFNCPLSYYGTVTNGTPNEIVFNYSGGGFSSTYLISAKIITENYTNAINVKKAISDAGGTATFNLNCLGGTDQRYGTNTVYFRQFETNDATKARITSLTSNTNGTLDLTARVQVGTSNEVYSTTNLNNLLTTNIDKFYVAPIIDTIDSGWSNVTRNVTPSNLNQEFYTVKSFPAYQ